MFKIHKYHLGKFLIAILMVLQISCSEESNKPIMGTNLASINYYSSQLPFLNEFKSSQSWITQNQQTWNTKEQNLLDTDNSGWVESLPSEGAETEYTRVGSLLFRGHNNYLPGNYVVLYEGEGEIEYRFDATKKDAISSPGRDVIEVNPSNAGIFLSITETDPDGTGDYIRNIKVIHEDSESLATTETFNPEFLNKIQPFDTLRFMDWMETNGSKQKEWADRPKPEDARYSEVGAPVEIMVELANSTDANPWFTMPHLASDEYVENFANYVKENLEPELEVYVEYSNEVWNGQFEQSRWADEQAKQEWPNSDLNRHDWYSRRTTEVVQIWDEVWNQDSERVIGVMSAQSANIGVGQRVLDYNWSDDASLSHSDTGIDAIAIAPYFGSYIGKPENEAELESWTEQPDGGLDKLFQEITEGGVLSNSPEGGALALAYRNMEAYAQLAEQEGLPLLAYEGGQHLVGTRGLENNQAITNLFITANRDPRMGEIYRDYLEQWTNTRGDLFVNFSDVGKPSKWGSWGALESVYQESSPKYDAIIDFIEDGNSDTNSASSEQIIGEVGKVDNFNHRSQTIQLENSYDNPVVFALPLSRNGNASAIARITDIQSNNFTAFLQEPEYQDGIHNKESFSYVVLEAGSWQLDDGSSLEVGSFNSSQTASSNWQNIGFQNSFDNTPVVLSQVQTYNEEDFVRTRQANADISGFSLTMEEEEALKSSGHDSETIGWLAMESGRGSWGDLSYQAGNTGDEVTSRWHTLDFAEEFTDSPHLLASLASYDGADSAGIRFRNLDSDSVQITIEEDRSLDSETNHTTEVVDFLAISDAGNLMASAYDADVVG
jgi:hypothetical protein